jgi:hypothetical protein
LICHMLGKFCRMKTLDAVLFNSWSFSGTVHHEKLISN